jgi:hypothetical protein
MISMNRSTTRKIWLISVVTLAAVLLPGNAYGQRGGFRPPGAPSPSVPHAPGPQVPVPQSPLQPNPQYRQSQPLPKQQPHTVWVTVWSCSRCGAEISRGDQYPAFITFCPRCGANFAGMTITEKKEKAQSDSLSALSAYENPDTFLPLLQIILGGIFITILAVLLAVIYKRRKQSMAIEQSDMNQLQ